MRTSEYRAWLQMRISEKGAKDKISRCKKVEMALSTDLDAEYKSRTYTAPSIMNE